MFENRFNEEENKPVENSTEEVVSVEKSEEVKPVKKSGRLTRSEQLKARMKAAKEKLAKEQAAIKERAKKEEELILSQMKAEEDKEDKKVSGIVRKFWFSDQTFEDLELLIEEVLGKREEV